MNSRVGQRSALIFFLIMGFRVAPTLLGQQAYFDVKGMYQFGSCPPAGYRGSYTAGTSVGSSWTAGGSGLGVPSVSISGTLTSNSITVTYVATATGASASCSASGDDDEQIAVWVAGPYGTPFRIQYAAAIPYAATDTNCANIKDGVSASLEVGPTRRLRFQFPLKRRLCRAEKRGWHCERRYISEYVVQRAAIFPRRLFHFRTFSC
jgi:hypothetical protein